jgi:hypothetical protein
VCAGYRVIDLIALIGSEITSANEIPQSTHQFIGIRNSRDGELEARDEISITSKSSMLNALISTVLLNKRLASEQSAVERFPRTSAVSTQSKDMYLSYSPFSLDSNRIFIIGIDVYVH